MYQNDKNWMKVALKYAQHAQDIGEIPVGAVLISKQNIIGIGWNNSINQNDPTAHAEIMAIRYAGKNIKNYRLIQTTLYVTLQPCIMCFGAIIHSRIKRLVFGAKNKSITRTSVPKNIFLNAKKNHNIEIKTNIMKSECSEILIKFFQNKRKKIHSRYKIIT